MLVLRYPNVENQDPNVPLVVDEPRKRGLQQVCTNVVRKEVVAWMIEDATCQGEDKVISRAVRAFPEHFRAPTKNANLAKASRWWKDQDRILHEDKSVSGPNCVVRSNIGKRTKCQPKTRGGRGRKRAPWVTWLYSELIEEFERLRKAGVKFSPTILCNLACTILQASIGDFNPHTVDGDGVLIMQKIKYQWIRYFMDVHDIVCLSQRGRLLCKPC